MSLSFKSFYLKMILNFKTNNMTKYYVIIYLASFLQDAVGIFSPATHSATKYQGDSCPDHKYVPLHGSRKPMPDSSYLFHEGSVLRYVCDDSYNMNPPQPTQTCHNGNWIPSKLPHCTPTSGVQCTNSIRVYNGFDWSDVPVDVGEVVYASDIRCHSGYSPDFRIPHSTCTEDGTWSNNLACIAKQEPFCSRPPSLEHGVVFCCEDKGHNVNQSDFCCFPGGKVQFECNSGYYMSSGDLEWHCTSSNNWSPSHTPICTKDYSTEASHSDEVTISDGMIKMVVAVTSGILGLLLIVVAFAFCKPRLKEIKRRWRDFREDENGLIVDGRRVNLPSYEQATSNAEQPQWPDFYQVAPAPCLNPLTSNQLEHPSDVTRPPQSNLEEFTPHGPSSHPYSPLRNEETPDFSHNPPPEQFLASAEDQLTVVEFLREFPSTSAGISAEISGFEDNFVPIASSGRAPLAPNSPTSSLSSDEAISAPLLMTSSRQRSTPNVKVKCKGVRPANEDTNVTTPPVQDDPPLDLSPSTSAPQPAHYSDTECILVEAGDSLGLDRISLSHDTSLSPRDPNHADSTTV